MHQKSKQIATNAQRPTSKQPNACMQHPEQRVPVNIALSTKIFFALARRCARGKRNRFYSQTSDRPLIELYIYVVVSVQAHYWCGVRVHLVSQVKSQDLLGLTAQLVCSLSSSVFVHHLGNFIDVSTQSE